ELSSAWIRHDLRRRSGLMIEIVEIVGEKRVTVVEPLLVIRPCVPDTPRRTPRDEPETRRLRASHRAHQPSRLFDVGQSSAGHLLSRAEMQTGAEQIARFEYVPPRPLRTRVASAISALPDDRHARKWFRPRNRQRKRPTGPEDAIPDHASAPHHASEPE